MYEIISQLSASKNPLQNGVMERSTQTLMDTVRLIMVFPSLPSFLGICLRDYVLASLPKRYINLQEIQEDLRVIIFTFKMIRRY